MPSDPRFLSVIRAAVSELTSVSGLSDTDARRIVLALDEALANIIRHAYKSRHDQTIRLECETSADLPGAGGTALQAVLGNLFGYIDAGVAGARPSGVPRTDPSRSAWRISRCAAVEQ